MQNAPGKSILKVSGIIIIIFAGIALVLGLIAFAGIGVLAAMGMSAGLLTMVMIFSVISAAFSMFMGVMAVMNCEKPEKAPQLKLLGIIAIALVVVDFILGVAIMPGLAGGAVVGALISAVLPVLVVVGATKNIQG